MSSCCSISFKLKCLGVCGVITELPGGAVWVREVVREGCYQGSWLINPGLARSVGHIYVDLLLNILVFHPCVCLV